MKNLFSALFSMVLLTSVSLANPKVPGKNCYNSSPDSKNKEVKIKKDTKGADQSEGEVFFRSKAHKSCFKSITVC